MQRDRPQGTRGLLFSRNRGGFAAEGLARRTRSKGMD